MKSCRRRHLLPATLAFLVACHTGEPSLDGGPVDAVADSATGPAGPEIDWLTAGTPALASPVFTPCPDGWRGAESGDSTVCEPYPEAGRESCAASEVHLPGEPACRPVGAPCPSGDFDPALPDDGSVIYVLAGAAAGGDGSRASPFATLSEVSWSSIGAGETVALSRGTHDGTLALRAGARVLGACASETFVTGSDAPVPAVVTISSAGDPAVLENLTIGPAPNVGIRISDGRSVRLDGVVLDRVTDRAIFADDPGTTITLEDVRITNTRAAADRTRGRAMMIQQGARLDGSRVEIDENREVAVAVVGDGATVTLSDAIVRDTRPQDSDRAFGRGVDVEIGGRFEGTRVVIEHNLNLGLIVDGEGSTAELTDVIIRGTDSEVFSRSNGAGVNVRDGAALSCSRVLVDDNRAIGLFVEGGDVTLADVIIRSTRVQERDLDGGRGINAQASGTINGERVVVDSNHDVGIYADGEETTLTFEDLVVRDTAATEADQSGGRGLALEFGAAFTATRLLFEGNHEIGVFAMDPGTEVSLVDAAIRDTRPRVADSNSGEGLVVQSGARFDATRLLVAHSQNLGLVVSGPEAIISLVDAVVRDTQPNAATGIRGAGAFAQAGGLLELSRVLVESNRLSGIASIAGVVTGAEVEVRGVEPAACGDTTCPEMSAGYGIVADSGSLELTRFVVADARTCGAALWANPVPADMDLHDGEIRGSDIGACVQAEGYDLSRLMDGVAYRDNGTNLDAVTLPVPEAVDEVEPSGP
jgi:hypothetical protein